jgi:hypothetical protein
MKSLSNVRILVLMAAIMKVIVLGGGDILYSSIFWDVKLCSLLQISQCFGGLAWLILEH